MIPGYGGGGKVPGELAAGFVDPGPPDGLPGAIALSPLGTGTAAGGVALSAAFELHPHTVSMQRQAAIHGKAKYPLFNLIDTPSHPR